MANLAGSYPETQIPADGITHTSRLRVNFLWTLAGNVVYSASQWGILAALAKLGNPELVGQYALGLAIAMPVTMFTNLQLRSVQMSDVGRTRAFGDYLGFRLFATLIALVVILAICFGMRYPAETIAVISTLALVQGIEAISDIYYGNLQLNGRMDRIAISMILRGPLSLAGVAVAVQLTHRLIWGIITLAVVRALILFSYDVRDKVQNYSRRNLPDWRKIAKFRLNGRPQLQLFQLTFPLGVVALLLSMNTNVPRYFIASSSGVRDLGIFSAIAFLLSAGNMVVGALGQSAFVPLARYYAAGDNAAFLHLLRRLLLVGLALGIGGVLVAKFAGAQLLTLLYRPEYARRTDVLIWLMVAACFSYLGQFVGYAVTAAQYFSVQIPLFATVTAATVVSSYVLVPAKGLLGAAMAILIAMAVQLAGCAIVLIFAVNKRDNMMTLARTA